MISRQWYFITALGLIVFNIAVIYWGLNLFFNGSNNARIYIMLSSVITVPILFATIVMNIICLFCSFVPENLQKKLSNFGPSEKNMRLWRVIDDVIDFFD